jgi:tetratricopeptide (TPR) repeat protein
MVGAALLAAAAVASSPAAAQPTMWSRARDPAAATRADVNARLDALRAKLAARRTLGGEGAPLKQLYLKEAKRMLEEAGALASTDSGLRQRYGWVLHQLGEHLAAIRVLEDVLRAEPPAPMRVAALMSLADAYTQLGRYGDEVRAWDDALELEPDESARSTIFANRGEGLMGLGNLSAAMQSYQSALSYLTTQMEMATFGVTIRWSMALAADRSGDLDLALDSIRMARTYDRRDALVFGAMAAWRFVPEHDEVYARALGFWETARHAELGAARAEAYGRAVEALGEFVARAPANDLWLGVARTRLKQCEQERELFLRRSGVRAVRPAPAPARPVPAPKPRPARPAGKLPPPR